MLAWCGRSAREDIPCQGLERWRSSCGGDCGGGGGGNGVQGHMRAHNGGKVLGRSNIHKFLMGSRRRHDRFFGTYNTPLVGGLRGTSKLGSQCIRNRQGGLLRPVEITCQTIQSKCHARERDVLRTEPRLVPDGRLEHNSLWPAGGRRPLR